MKELSPCCRTYHYTELTCRTCGGSGAIEGETFDCDDCDGIGIIEGFYECLECGNEFEEGRGL